MLMSSFSFCIDLDQLQFVFNIAVSVFEASFLLNMKLMSNEFVINIKFNISWTDSHFLI